MKASDRYLKLVEWSSDDNCYVGTCPGLMLGGVHGEDEGEVYAELCKVVEGWIETIENEGGALPPETAGKDYSGKFLLRVDPDLHKSLAVRALQAGRSLNAFCRDVLKTSVSRRDG